MSINMGHIAAAAAASSSPKTPGAGGGGARYISSLSVVGRQPSQTQIPVPKKLTIAAQCATARPFARSDSSSGTSSVAARAQMFQNNSSNCYNGSTFRSNSGVLTAKGNGSAPGSPLRSPGCAPQSPSSDSGERSTSPEKGPGAREAADLRRRLQQMQREHEATQRELRDRDEKLAQLRTVSERVYKEYDQLKNRYEVETGAMHQAMQRASEWYKQNRALKRRSTAIMQKFIEVQPDGALLDLMADETDAVQAAKDGDELEDLRNTVKRLSGEVARLQSELNALRLQEFEAQEKAVEASVEQAELAELRALRDNMSAAAALLQREVAVLRDQCEQERQAARRLKSEADKAVKERNVLAHQSSLLAEALSQDDRLVPLLAEVESLKRLLEDARMRSRELQQQDQDVELFSERLRVAEDELRRVSERAERAERENQELRDRLSQTEKEIEGRMCAPPPPPPPPPPPLVSAPVRLRTRGGSGANSATGSSEDLVNAERGSAVQDMANLLGIPRKPQVPEAIPGGAIDNIINQIKGGRFTLKATEQHVPKEKKDEPPPAVTEMLNILGTLRRRPRDPVINTSHLAEAPRDVAL